MDPVELLRQLVRDLMPFIEAERPVALSAALAALLLLAWIGGTLRIRRYGHRLLRTLIESTPERIQAQRKRLGGFRAEIAAPPDPFRRLTVTYTTRSPLNPLAVLAALFGRAGGRLIIQAQFKTPPSAELAWLRGGVPGQAIGREISTAAWVYRKLAIINSEFATRGNTIEPLIWSFTEFQARFNPAIQRICIQRGVEHELEIVANMNTLTTEILPHLIASAWSLGQAATRGRLR